MDAKFYVLNSYSLGFGRHYSEVAAVVGETEKTYSAHLRFHNSWGNPRRINKNETSGKFSTLEEAEAALNAIRATSAEFTKRRSELAREEQALIDAILAGERSS